MTGRKQHQSSARILVLDIETAPMTVLTFGLFNQNIGINQVLQPGRVIAFAAKWLGEKDVEFWSEFDEPLIYTSHKSGHDQMIAEAYRLYCEADIIVHYNGTSFDLPHLRTEFVKLGLTPPAPVYEVDLLQTAKKVFRFDSNKLQYVSTSLGLPGKVANAGMPLWIGCMNGDPKSWAEMKRYNIQDVKLTEKLYLRLRGWVKSHPHLGAYEGDELLRCPNCGGTHLEKRGTRPTGQGAYQRYRCLNPSCGKWLRGTKTVQLYQQTRGIQ